MVTELVLGTLNLRNFIAPPFACYESDNIYSDEHWQQKCRWLTELVKRSQPDVLAMQEVFSVEALRQLLMPLGYEVAVVDSPKVLSDYIYHQPVTAIASRWPLLALAPVEHKVASVQALGLADAMTFSRAPLWCRIDLPQFGPCDCYVVHFKSQRPGLQQALPCLPDTADGQWMRMQLGCAASAMQRSAEAALLWQVIAQRRLQDRLPVALFGDFNQGLDSAALAILTDEAALQRIDRQRPLTSNNEALDNLILRDSFVLHQLQNPDFQRLPTHYWGGRGSVLDYILLSAEFDCRSPSNLGDVSSVMVDDSHIFGPNNLTDIVSSDHALVTVTLTPRH